jgi:hypothetical protein
MISRRLLLAAIGAACLANCGPKPEPTSPQPASSALPGEVAEDPGTPWSRCAETFTPSGDCVADVGNLGRLCGVKNSQRPLTPVRTAEQTSSEAVQRYTFTAGGPGKCYRVFAVAEAGVRDIDVQVTGPDGDRLASDTSAQPVAMVPGMEPLCLGKVGVYTVEVSVFRGSGRYAMQIWGN